MKQTILVTGATGKQGGAVAQHLLKNGFPVKALTRNPSSTAANKLKNLGAEIVKGDLEDKQSLVVALQGCNGIFSVQNFWEKGVGYSGEIRQAKNLIEAAQQSKINHFVQASISGCDRAIGVKHFESKYEVEKLIQASNIPYTFLRPVMFMENFIDKKVKKVIIPIMRGIIPDDVNYHLVTVEDIGAIGAIVFAYPEKYRNKIINIASDIVPLGKIGEIQQQITGEKIPKYKMPAWITSLINGDMKRQLIWNKIPNGWNFSLEETKAVLPKLTSLSEFFQKHTP